MTEVCIIAALRTPIGSFGGSIKNFSATQLGAFAIKGLLDKTGISPELVTDVLMGSVIQANLGQAPARQAARFAGLADQVNCTTINKVCASGMKSVSLAAQSILLGDSEIVIAGGMESMSNAPFYANSMRWGNRFGNSQMIDGLVKDGLTDVYDGKAMGHAAEICASTCGITREEQDAFAMESYRRSQMAVNEGRFEGEIIPVIVPQRNGGTLAFSRDEEPFNVSLDKMASLKGAFMKDGTVTAANASTISDGAAALLLMSGAKATEMGLKPIARILSYADAEQAPEWFTTSPSLAIPRAVQKAGLKMEDISYWEINEAFAAVAIENSRRMKLDPSRVNVNGGAVALGHPLGCSGARIIVTLISVLKQRGARYGAAGICNGGGGASAMVIENF